MVLLYRGLLYDTGINLNKRKSFSSFHEVNTSSIGKWCYYSDCKMGTDCSGGLIYSKEVTGCRGMPLQGIEQHVSLDSVLRTGPYQEVQPWVLHMVEPIFNHRIKKVYFFLSSPPFTPLPYPLQAHLL